MSEIVQVVSESGEIRPEDFWFEEDDRLGEDSIMVVSILGGQGSGKSSFMNAIFGTEFEVAERGSIGSSTTKGIIAAKPTENRLIVALDVEGADARDRGSGGKTFLTKCSGFAASLSDVVIVNMWHHDLGRVNSATYTCLEAIMNEQAKARRSGGSIKSLLLFVVHDVDEDSSSSSIKSKLVSDAQETWERLSGPGSVDEVFDMELIALPHIRYMADEFEAAIATARDNFDPARTVYFKEQYSKSIPAAGLSAYAKNLWEVVYQKAPAATAADLVPGKSDAVVKSDLAFSAAFQNAHDEIAALEEKLDMGEKIQGLGQTSARVLSDALEIFSGETSEFEEDPSVQRKKQELVTFLQANLHAVFKKQILLLKDKAIATFKGSTDEGGSPTDFIFYQVDNQFGMDADDSVMPGSNWSYENERKALHTYMEEYSKQRTRLYDQQLAAAQESRQAIRYLQMQETRMQQIQQQHYGGVSGNWNVGAAYRPPDSNVNISVGYQQGRTNIQISMVPDEQSSLLGPNGFTAGVGPANLGLSFNITV
mmetsp:Transcript_27305/g.106719  ORF Transcript_27305/g.106719 Transcript_27305/m.106719 type:complete len:538 (-) Transcript_27305:346-1959(-)